MADKKITELDAATALSADDLFPVVQGGETKKAALSLVPLPEGYDDLVGLVGESDDSRKSQTHEGRLKRLEALFGGIAIPASWGTNWFAKLAAGRAGTGKARSGLIGDSIGQGLYADHLYDGWGNLLGPALRGANGSSSDGGSGFIGAAMTPFYINAMGGGAAGVAAYGAELWATTGTVLVESPGNTNQNYLADGPGALVLQMGAGATAQVAVRGSNVEVFFNQRAEFGTQHYTVSIDGVVVETLALPATKGVVKKTYTPGPGNHVVLVTFVGNDSGGFGSLFGVRASNATGVVYDNYSGCGISSFSYDGLVGTQGNTHLELAINAASGTYGPARDWTGGSQNPADLIIYALSANDCNNIRTPDAFGRDMALFFQAITALATPPDVLVVIPHLAHIDPGGIAAGIAERAKSVAAFYGAASIDFNEIARASSPSWESKGYFSQTAPGTSGGTDAHPSTAGHAFMASAVLSIVSP